MRCLREVGEGMPRGLGLQTALAKVRSFEPVLSQRPAGGMHRMGEQQLLRSKQEADCGVSPKRLKRRAVYLA